MICRPSVKRETFSRDALDILINLSLNAIKGRPHEAWHAAIEQRFGVIYLDWPTRVLCLLLITGILALGVAPARVLNTLSTSVANLNTPAPISAVANSAR